MGLKCKIIINPYLRPKQSVTQAQRIGKELTNLGVSVDIVTDAFLRLSISEGSTFGTLLDTDFIVYLDKDKYVSELLSKQGVTLFNSHNSIRVCDDKARTYIALTDMGYIIPKTVFAPLCYNAEDNLPQNSLERVVDTLGGFPIIVKECYGSMGKGVHKASDFQGLSKLHQELKATPHMFQEYISSSEGKDLRITVVGGKAISVMMRRNDFDFRSNVGQGGKGIKIDLHDEKYKTFILTAENVAKTLNLDYCGVDLLVGKNFNPIICEVNSNAFFEETESVCGVNVAKEYALHMLNCLNKN